MKPSPRGTSKTATVMCEKELTMGLEYKVIYSTNGYAYYRAIPIIDLRSEECPNRYILRYSDCRKIERTSISAFLCLYCQDDCFEWFVTSKEIREQLKLRSLQGVHMACLERELGRKLTIKDFPDCPGNKFIRIVFQMGRRAQRKKDRKK